MTLQDVDRSLQHAARLHVRAVALLPLGAILLMPLSSVAQPTSPAAPSGVSVTAPDQPHKELHRSEALKRAAAAIRANRPLEALAGWREAYAIRPDFRITCNIGMAERSNGSQRAAAVFLTECLQQTPSSPTEDENRRLEKMRNALAEARAQIGVVEIIITEAGARVSIDGESVPSLPVQQVFVEPGTRQIAVELEGYERAERSATVARGEVKKIFIKLKRIEPKPALVPAPIRPIAPTVPIALLKPIPADKPQNNPSTMLTIGGIALSGAGAGLGVVFRVTSADAASNALYHQREAKYRYLADCTSNVAHSVCSDYINAQHGEHTLERASTAMFITAGTVAVATLVYAVLPRVFTKPKSTQNGSMLVVKQW